MHLLNANSVSHLFVLIDGNVTHDSWALKNVGLHLNRPFIYIAGYLLSASHVFL
jgi:hypothetical protein